MEENRKKVFSMLAGVVVFIGTQHECESYKQKYENSDNSLYIVKA